MLPDLERLIELQQVDLHLQELTRQIQAFPQQRAQVEKQRTEAEEALAQIRSRHTESLKQRKKLELDVQQLEEKISKLKGQLYEVKSNEAYRTLQHEIEIAEKEKGAAEDRELEAMIAVEDLEKAARDAEAALKQVVERVAAELSRLDQEEGAREKEGAELTVRRTALRETIGEEHLTIYDRVSRAHQGIGLAEAQDEICQVCRIHIRPQIYAEVKRSDEIHYCESCHRILYYLAPVPSGDQPVSSGD
jgi:hypothetical protein